MDLKEFYTENLHLSFVCYKFKIEFVVNFLQRSKSKCAISTKETGTF